MKLHLDECGSTYSHGVPRLPVLLAVLPRRSLSGDASLGRKRLWTLLLAVYLDRDWYSQGQVDSPLDHAGRAPPQFSLRADALLTRGQQPR